MQLNALTNLLLSQPLITLFGIIATGLALGRVRVKGINLGTSGVLFTALAAGHFGYPLPRGVGELGLVLFVYCVGIGAGDRFFASLIREGAALAKLAVLIVSLGALMIWTGAALLDLPAGLATGIFAGALTSTPALAAATEALPDSGADSASIGYGVAYPFGVIGVVLFVQVLPRLLRLRLADEQPAGGSADLTASAYVKVTQPTLFGEPIRAGGAPRFASAKIRRIYDGKNLVPPRRDAVFHDGQIVLLSAAASELEAAILRIGERSAPPPCAAPRNELCHDSAPCGTTTGARRPDAATAPCLLSLTLGLSLGVLLGNLPLGPIRLGLTGGPLFVALLLGHFGKIGPIVSAIPRQIRTLLQELGLVFFLASAGVRGGGMLMETLRAHGPALLLLGACVSVVPLAAAWLVATRCLKMNPLQALGGICGGMTSTPALGAITAKTDSQTPVVSYASAYPVALIFMIVVSKLLIRLIG